MSKDNKTTLFSVLVFTLKSNYLLFTYLFVPLLVNSYKNTAYLAPIAMFVLVFLLVLFLPKSLGSIDYNKILNKSKIVKVAYYLYQTISLVLNVVICAYTVGRMFFYENEIAIFILATVLLTLFVSTGTIEVIFNSSTFLFIIGILLIIFPMFLTNDVKDYTLLKPFNLHYDFSFLLMIYFGLDAISIVMSGVDTKKKINKWFLLIPIAITFFFFSMESLNIILVTGNLFLLDNEFLGFFTLFIQDTINYMGNIGLVFLFIIPLVGCYKSGYALRKIKDAFNIKEKLLHFLTIGVILFGITFMIIEFWSVISFSYYAVILSIILLTIVYVFIIMNRSTTYEIRF